MGKVKRPRHGAPGRSHSTSSVRRLKQNGGLAVPGYSGSDDNDDSGSRCRHDVHASTSSSSSLSHESTQPPPPPSFDITKTTLRSQYASQTPKRNTGTNQQLEIEATAEKSRNLITSDGEGGGEARPQAPTSEGVIRGDKKWPNFADLGGMVAVIEQLMMEVVVPLCHPELPQCLGVRLVAGLLLHGPPGCGKTTLAHAIANETGVSFHKISAPEIVSSVSGGSEENIRSLFQKAYRTASSIVFIDGIDEIASKRENLQREMERRIVTQLMTCVDEFHQNIGGGYSDADSSEMKPGYVIVVGATNRPDAVDQALRRPGRFDREISLGVSDENARKQILKTVNEAAMEALEERWESLENGTSSMSSSCSIDLSHFERALSKVKPSVSEQQRKHYEALSKWYSSN